MIEHEALATAEMFTDDEIAALRSLANDLAMDQTERFGSPALYPTFRGHFLRQSLDRMITERYPVVAFRKRYGKRHPLRAEERMSPGHIRLWIDRASRGVTQPGLPSR